MNVWLIYNRKGGVGKTTSAANLGAALAADGHPTLLVDTDDQRNLSHCFGRKDATPTLYEYLTGEAPLTLHPTDFENLSIITASKELAGLQSAIDHRIFEAFRADATKNILAHDIDALRVEYLAPKLQQLLARVEGAGVEYVLLDTPATINTLVEIAFHLCTDLIVPVQCAELAVDGIDQVRESMAEVYGMDDRRIPFAALLAHVKTRVHILRTMASPQWSHPRDQAARIVDEYGVSVLEAQIKRSVAADEAVKLRIPAVFADPSHDLSRNYIAAMRELVSTAKHATGVTASPATAP
jgi:chromosome partitioning protein